MAGRKFNPAQHPRDRFGRFTKSRTVKASAKDKVAARQVAEGFAPKRVADRQAYLQQVAGGDTADLGDVTEVNKALRAGKDSPAADALEAQVVALPDDVLLSRSVPLAAFGATDPESLTGMKVRDAGFAPTQLGTLQASDGQVRMRIAAPAGTRAAVNPETGEIVLDRDTEMVVARVEKTASGHDMYLTVLPRQGAEPDMAAPDGVDPVRADLMKLKVPDLQARMRERGLKPGRMRKTQLVDALVADETGTEEPAANEPAGPEAQVLDAVRAVIDAEGRRPGDFVNVADVRDRLAGMDRAEQDTLLRSLDRERLIQLEVDPARNTLPRRVLDAGIRIGGENLTLVTVLRPEPDGGDEVQAAAADADAQRIQQQWEAAKARLLRRWPKLAAPMVTELAGQAEAAVEVGDLALLGELQVSAGVVAALAVPLRKTGSDLAVDAAAGVVEEAAAQDVSIVAPDVPARDRVEQHADAVARIIAAGYASGAARAALQLAGAGPQDVRAEVERHLTELGESVNGLVGDNIGSLLSAAQFAGRLAVLEKHPARGYEATETLDRNTCPICLASHQVRYSTLRAALIDYPLSGQRRGCEGRGRCRGYVKPIF